MLPLGTIQRPESVAVELCARAVDPTAAACRDATLENGPSSELAARAKDEETPPFKPGPVRDRPWNCKPHVLNNAVIGVFGPY